MVGECSFLPLGEATHGTHEFHAMRAQITRRLIQEHGFDGVAYLGTQGDPWDAQQDMLLATLGSVLATAWLRLRR